MPGSRWNYSTGETQVAGALLRAAVGSPLAEYLSDRIWARFGMESDATWWLESPDGLEVGGSGLSATLRDYGRFGLFLIGGGKAGGEQILPEGWVKDAGSTKIVDGKPVDYGYMLWPIPNAAGTINQGAFEARVVALDRNSTHMPKFELTTLETHDEATLISKVRRVARVVPEQHLTEARFDSVASDDGFSNVPRPVYGHGLVRAQSHLYRLGIR
jgi:hypothetical protein